MSWRGLVGVALACCVLAGVCAIAPASTLVSKVHIVYMTHLDLGFTDTTRNVCDRYFELYFPSAFQTSAQLRQMCNSTSHLRTGKQCPVYKWTEFPWLVQEFLDAKAGCAHRQRTPDEIKAMEEAIANDDVIWHANALNSFNELMDAPLLKYSLGMHDKLNQKFGKKHGRVAGKLTDVTGMSRSTIPVFAKGGVKAFHVGYNGVGGLPIVAGQGTPYQTGSSFCGDDTGCPATAMFRWQHAETNTEMLMLIEDNYGSTTVVPLFAPNRSAKNPQSDPDTYIALAFMYVTDNTGVPTATDVVNFWNSLQGTFPNATLVASSLDDFFEEVLASDTSRIPVVTQELGDSWLYGAPSDPVKLATFRQARRSLEAAKQAARVSESWWQYDSFMRRLMKGPPEHNWGLSIGSACLDCRLGGSDSTWTNAAFALARVNDSYRWFDCPDGFSPGSARWGSQSGKCGYGAMELEWAQQREWMHPLPSWSYERGWTRVDLSNDAKWVQFTADLELAMLDIRSPVVPSTRGMLPLPPHNPRPQAPTNCGGVGVAFGTNGWLSQLVDTQGRDWVGGSGMVGNFAYTTFSHDDFVTFAEQWNNHFGDFDKPGVETAAPVSKEWDLKLGSMHSEVTASGCRFVAQYQMADATAHTTYGAPGLVTVEYVVPSTDGSSLADINFTYHNKTATRLPEAMWVSFAPLVSNSAEWSMDVLGSPVNPLGVAQRGTRFKHTVWEGFKVQDSGRTLSVTTLDSALVAPGDRQHLLRYSQNNEQPNMAGGMHVNLLNNLWGTAFPQYYDDNGIARFVLAVS